jgi:hypothetical protein
MEIKPETRLIISAGIVLLGGVCCPMLNPAMVVGGAVTVELINAFVNVATGTAANAWDALVGRKNSDRPSLENHDLTKTVGKAIATVLEKAAKRDDEIGRKLKKIAKQAEDNWVKIAQNKSTQENSSQPTEAKLDQFLTQEGNLSPEDWGNIFIRLNMAAGKNGGFSIPPEVRQEVADLLHSTFPKALRETLKQDFSQDGKAFAGLILQLLTGMKAEIANQGNQEKEEFAKILQHIETVETQLKGNPEQIQQFFVDLSTNIDFNFAEIHEKLGRIEGKQDEQLAISEQTLKSTGRIEDNQHKILEYLKKPCQQPGFQPVSNPSDFHDIERSASQQTSFDINFEETENRCFQEIDDGRQMIIRIKAPENMGKNTLVKKIEDYASEKQYLTVRLDFWLPTEETFQDYSKFLQWCCDQVSEQLSIETIESSQHWNQAKGDDNAKINSFFNKQIMPKINTTILVLFLSSLDRVFPLSFAKKFLGLLRSWQNTKTWKNLRLVLSHSTECYIDLYKDEEDSTISPFNVGVRIELEEFNYKEIKDFAKKNQIDLDDRQIKQILSEVGGHPYLIDQIFSFLKAKMKTQNKDFSQVFDEVVSFTFLEPKFDRQYLYELYSRLEKKAYLLDVIRNLLEKEPAKIEDKKILFMLESIGLVIRDNTDREKIIFRNNLYRQYFSQKLGKK